MSDIIASRKAHYWGTSEWAAEAIEEAYELRSDTVCASR